MTDTKALADHPAGEAPRPTLQAQAEAKWDELQHAKGTQKATWIDGYQVGYRARGQESADWKQAIDDALVSAHLGTVESIPDPKAALNQLLAWHQMVALDPRVSEDARGLVDRGRRESADHYAEEIARLKATVRLYREA